VDLSGLGPGLLDVEVKIECSDGRVRILEKDPARVSLRLEPIRERSIPVRIRALDEAPVGFTMLMTRATPSQVTIRGAAPLADLVSEAYVELRLEGSKVTFSKTYRPVLRDVQGKEIVGVDLSPTAVQVEVPIEQLRNFKTVSIKAVITGTVAPGYWMSGVVVQPPTVSFGGDPQILDSFGYVETTPVDVSAAVTEVLRSVSIDIPAGTALEKKPEVFVKVSVQPIPGGQIVRRPVVLLNVSKGITATLSLSAVDLRLAGPVADLQRLRPTDISASIEVTGLLTGTYTLPIQVTGVPTGTTVLEVTPERVSVSLR
jgi:YbbR domain-containing protein